MATATLQDGQQMEITAMVDSPANLAALSAAHAPEEGDPALSSTPTPALSSAINSALSSAVSNDASAIMGESATNTASIRGSSSPLQPSPGSSSSNVNDKVITGSTIIFFDEPDQADKTR